MTILSPDVSSRLKPDFIGVVHTIYSEFCNLQRDARVLVITDARTPSYVVATFHGMALAAGADAVTLETRMPAGGPTYQPGAKWSPMLAQATKAADLIVDLGVGYADFIAEAIGRGARVIMPGDGIGNPYLEDMLIRTIRDTDVHAVRRTADRVAARFSEAKTCRMISGDGDELRVDISGLDGASVDGFLWDKDKQAYKSDYAILPPACPGVFLPMGRAEGTVSVDGTLLWHPVYHEQPRECLRLRFADGRLVEMSGDAYLANRLRNWLETLGDDGAWRGPVHLNVGISPNALLTQNQEWERVLGSVTCGMGDMPAALFAGDSNLKWSRSGVHWDWTILQPTILLDDQVLASDGKLFA
jgi:leucyl aminopeptidase (aminopeptidase T)